MFHLLHTLLISTTSHALLLLAQIIGSFFSLFQGHFFSYIYLIFCGFGGTTNWGRRIRRMRPSFMIVVGLRILKHLAAPQAPMFLTTMMNDSFIHSFIWISNFVFHTNVSIYLLFSSWTCIYMLINFHDSSLQYVCDGMCRLSISLYLLSSYADSKFVLVFECCVMWWFLFC